MTRPRIDEACTKIVATVGPACAGQEKLAELIEAGVDVFRINSAHGSRDEHQRAVDRIRAAGRETGFPVAILMDLAGPKIRLGELSEQPLVCELGMELTFVRGPDSRGPRELTSTYDRLIDELAVGNQVMLADGTVTLQVESVDGERAVCRVIAPGEVRSRQGINLPGVKLSVPAMLPADIDNAIWAAKNKLDLVSLSFVRRGEEVKALRELLAEHQSEALVIAKIEKPEALDHLDSIVDAADGIMVARGDLGVEIDIAETPVAQKRIIRVCEQKMKPVIVATQMLESMHHSRRPTRAEASDVANAVIDGADACMLSGETAIGDYPVEAVKIMKRIARFTERKLLSHQRVDPTFTDRVHPITTAATLAATDIAEAIQAKLIVIATRSGSTAWVKSKSDARSLVPTLGVSDSPESVRRMNLFWGIKPLTMKQIGDTPALISDVCDWGKRQGGLANGDNVVFVAGTGVIREAHNVVLVHTVD